MYFNLHSLCVFAKRYFWRIRRVCFHDERETCNILGTDDDDKVYVFMEEINLVFLGGWWSVCGEGNQNKQRLFWNDLCDTGSTRICKEEGDYRIIGMGECSAVPSNKK